MKSLERMVGASALAYLLLSGSCGYTRPTYDGPIRLRVATYNIEDVRTTDLVGSDNPRLRAAARTLQRLRPNILLINEMAYDQPGLPGYSDVDGPGHNAERFVTHYLSVSQDSGLSPLAYQALSLPSNTGVSSGFDLDNNGVIVTDYPLPEAAGADGKPPEQTAQQRAYGGDAWGFGTFPGQYSMALFVSDQFEMMTDSARTFQYFLWSQMPDAMQPFSPGSDEPWYSEDEWAEMRLSSKNHVDLPIRLGNGVILHLLVSHPTPPAFDGPERRNKLRNHDEIRFWADYISGSSYMSDDHGIKGGYGRNDPFVVMGDLNADLDEGSSVDNPVGSLLALPRVNDAFIPVATPEGRASFPRLDPDDTAEWGLRVDYVLPSSDIVVLSGVVWRPDSSDVRASDHFPVYLDIVVPPAERGSDPTSSSD